MHPSAVSTGHAGLDAALSAVGYGPDLSSDTASPLLVVLPPGVPPQGVVRCLRHAMSVWSIDAYQWDARGTELQPVIDVWLPQSAASARAGVASRWAQGDATRILIVSTPPNLDVHQGQQDSDSLGWLLSTASAKLAQEGEQVLLVLLDAAAQLPCPPSGPVPRTSAPSLFGPASPLDPPGGITVVGAFQDGSYSIVAPQRPLPVLSTPFDARVYTPGGKVKRKRSVSDEVDEAYTDASHGWGRKKLNSCSHQIPALSPSRSTWLSHAPSPSLLYRPPPSQS